ncbi:GDT1-like protein 3 isoform X1 [Drosophila sechellia]|uniref:GM24201 n=1 Tax=Drosophila sechellia TaxID=7238 RepID=B4HE15_DROSE|nr:GDT1-like protein 3 isoform X1 [Drosophila sechellia]XP_032576588.1 GDT1-like protein 3 isoform X1 [Drosophila sechellia]EDW42107.1 GM24201 [Drosophila sechellia]
MSQNQSYFWQTTRHNVYLKRSAKWHMALALMVVLTFGTICAAEAQPDSADNAIIESGIQSNLDVQGDLNRPTDLSSLAEKPKDAADRPKTKGTFIDAFTASISVILLTELGDKTFFIAAIMAMRHPRLIVFGGAIAALALMTVLSCAFGMAANFIPKIYTYYISTALFLIFGLKMLYDGYKMKPTDAQEELEEVQTDLRKREDELLRKASRKYEDAEGKRKNSNSDKEDASEQALIHGRNSISTAAGSTTDMQHRQRKQRNHLNNNNSKQNSCDKTGNDDDDRDQHESEVFLKEGGRIVEQLKMKTYPSSPAHSAASSNQTEQTNSIAASTATVDVQLAGHPTDPSVGAALEPRAPLAGHDSMHSLNGSLNGDSGPVNGALKARLDRDVNAALVNDAESGRRRPQKRGATYFTMRILAQAFTMTFLAEWGDRSQLTTIILAASKDVYGVIAGGIIGHCICTGLAVIGGRLVASKISVRTVTIVGGIVFIGFAIYAVAIPPDDI